MSWSTHIMMTASNEYTPNDSRSENAKKLYFSDRSAQFSDNLNALLNLTSIDSLLFISNYGSWDSEGVYSEEFDEEVTKFTGSEKIVISPEKLDTLIADIDKLFLWCSNNLATTSTVFKDEGYGEEDVKQGIDEADKYTIKDCDYQSSGVPYFLFCALKSIQAFLKYCKENNMTVFYENLAEC